LAPEEWRDPRVVRTGDDMKKMDMKTDCKTCRTQLADLLLDERYAAAHPEAAEHMAACAECRKELEELQATFALLDSWTAPEPSEFFDTKLHARLREVQAAEPEGFWSRTRAFWMYSTGHRLRPVLAAALVLTVVVGGGGTFAGLYGHNAPIAVQASPTVNDLQILDKNAQALQQMDQLLDSGEDSSAPPAS
jgi:anti-sigma factor RsiW